MGYLLLVCAFFFMELSALTADEELSSDAESNVSDTGVSSPSVQAPFENTITQPIKKLCTLLQLM